jgi:hypothetical protein
LPPGQGNSFALTQLAPVMSPLEPHRDKLTMVGDIRMASRFDDPHSGGHIGMVHVLVGRRCIPTGSSEPNRLVILYGGRWSNCNVSARRRRSALSCAREVGREIATPAEVRAAMNLPSGAC